MNGSSLLHIVCSTLYEHGTPILLPSCNRITANESQRNPPRNCACSNVRSVTRQNTIIVSINFIIITNLSFPPFRSANNICVPLRSSHVQLIRKECFEYERSLVTEMKFHLLFSTLYLLLRISPFSAVVAV